MSLANVVETDVLVIGGGIAGCFAAIKAREQGLDVTIVDKAYAGKSGASAAAGRCCIVFNPEWGQDLDTTMNEINKRGEYLNNREWGEIVLKDSYAAYQNLVSWGAKFAIPIEGGKSLKDYPRFLKDHPPFGVCPIRRRELPAVLRRQAEKSGVKITDRIMATDLLKHDGEVVGAIGFSMDSYDLYILKAKATVVSAGSNSFKPAGFEISCLTGDAEAMAYRAGAEITGKEFLSTHSIPGPYPAWRSYNRVSFAEFPYLVDAEGNSIDIGHEPYLSMELAIHAGKGPLMWDLDAATPEDIKAMHKVQEQTDGSGRQHERGGIILSRRGKYPLVGGIAGGYANVLAAGIWVINTKCATSLPGLYAAGDCCGIRLVGAYHPVPGFGITGAAVTGKRAGLGAAEYALQTEKSKIAEKELAKLKKIVYAPAERKGGFSPRWVTQLLQNIMMPYFILNIRQGDRLGAALTIVEFLRDHLVPKLTAKDAHELRLAHETKNMVLNAEMILRASLFRTESRGQHYREDYPRRDDPTWLAWIKLKEEQGRMEPLKEPVPKEWWPDLSKPYEERYPRRFPGE